MRISDSLISSPHTSRDNSKSFLSSAVLDLLCWIEITDQGAEFWVVRVREVVARLNCYQIGKDLQPHNLTKELHLEIPFDYSGPLKARSTAPYQVPKRSGHSLI